MTKTFMDCLFWVILLNFEIFIVAGVVNRCCDVNQVLSIKYQNGIQTASCDNLTTIVHLNGTSDDKLSQYTHEDLIGNVTFEIVAFPNCSIHTVLQNEPDVWFRIQEDNNNIEVGLRWPFEPLWIRLPKNSYCLNEYNKTSINLNNETEPLKNYLLILCESYIDDYQVYLISRYFVGVSDLFSCVLFLAVVVIYVLLRKTHNIAGWLVFSISMSSLLYFFLSGILTIVDAPWLHVQTTQGCVIAYSVARYLQVVLTSCNLIAYWHMLLTFWKMSFRVKTISRSLGKLKAYIPIICILPIPFIIADQIFARHYPTSKLVQQTQNFAHGRCSPPETVFFDHALAMMVILTLIFVLASGLIILYLKFSSKLTNPSIKKEFVKTSILFFKLFGGSGSPILIRFLVFLYLGGKEPLRWYYTATFCATEVLSGLYYFFVFGVTRENIRKVSLKLQGKPLNSFVDSNATTRSATRSSTFESSTSF